MPAASPRVAVGIDIGGTKIAAGLIRESGDLVAPIRRIPTPRGVPAILAAIAELIAPLRASSDDPVAAIGIGSAGTISPDGVVVSATDAIPGWAGTALADLVAAGSGLPTVAVNDVHAAAVGERRLGHLRGVASGLLVAVGTGVGGAYLLPSGVVTGRSGSAGSIGHIQASRVSGRLCGCGGYDHVEAYASGPAMERAYGTETGTTIDLVAIADRAAAGELAAIRVLHDGAEVLGTALASMVQALDPHLIVLGGGVVDIGDLYLDVVRRSYATNSMPGTNPPPVVTVKLGSNTVVIGAALHVLDRLSVRAAQRPD